ncbi:MAG: hypothetical protein MZV70_36475 [Desulfobacterales bacterium]|nr:hypothetical protein [Desulfobacterales bacterium]
MLFLAHGHPCSWSLYFFLSLPGRHNPGHRSSLYVGRPIRDHFRQEVVLGAI